MDPLHVIALLLAGATAGIENELAALEDALEDAVQTHLASVASGLRIGGSTPHNRAMSAVAAARALVTRRRQGLTKSTIVESS